MWSRNIHIHVHNDDKKLDFIISELKVIECKLDRLLQDKIDKGAVAAATDDLSAGSDELKDTVAKNKL